MPVLKLAFVCVVPVLVRARASSSTGILLVPVLKLAFLRFWPLDQTGTGHQKSLAEKAKPVLERAYARIKTGTRSKTGSASFRTGIFLIRVLTRASPVVSLLASLGHQKRQTAGSC